MKGGYPPGVFEHTKNAPWNEHGAETCNACGRQFYCDGEPDTPRPDAMKPAPETEYGHEHTLCGNCECEFNVCTECGETFLMPDDGTPHTLNGCAECKLDAPCVRCGAPCSACECETCECETCDGDGTIQHTEYWKHDGSPAGHGHGHAVTFTDECPSCDGTGRTPDGAPFIARCATCNASAARDDIGTVCRACGRGIIRTTNNTKETP